MEHGFDGRSEDFQVSPDHAESKEVVSPPQHESGVSSHLAFENPTTAEPVQLPLPEINSNLSDPESPSRAELFVRQQPIRLGGHLDEMRPPSLVQPQSVEERHPVRPVSFEGAADPLRNFGLRDDEYSATEYGLHFPVALAGGGGHAGGVEPPKETANAEPADSDPSGKSGQNSSVWPEVKSLARDVAFAAITAILIVMFVVQPVKVEGTSMLPQLENGERIFVNKFIYDFDSVHRGDIVVFWFPDNPSQSFIKRVIGLPGDVIKVVNGRLYINDKLYEEPYLSPQRTQQIYSFGPHTVKQAHYFVMGDNRDASNDSRAWGEVPVKYIYGKAMFRYWPLSSFGTIPTQSDEEK
ncbi:MAG TPA: signal peptidase I [Blastocatellia bacterium]|nr:signal peptidase I [Blastocatellia bacterium]